MLLAWWVPFDHFYWFPDVFSLPVSSYVLTFFSFFYFVLTIPFLSSTILDPCQTYFNSWRLGLYIKAYFHGIRPLIVPPMSRNLLRDLGFFLRQLPHPTIFGLYFHLTDNSLFLLFHPINSSLYFDMFFSSERIFNQPSLPDSLLIIFLLCYFYSFLLKTVFLNLGWLIVSRNYYFPVHLTQLDQGYAAT